jgi:hypothetical protein
LRHRLASSRWLAANSSHRELDDNVTPALLDQASMRLLEAAT